MSKIKRSIAALLIALGLVFMAHKPSDHEKVSESPTEPEIEVNDAIPTEKEPETVVEPKAEPIDKSKAEPITTGEDTAEVEVTEPTKPEVAKAPPPQPKSSIYEYEATFFTAYCDGCTGITASGHDVRNTQFYNGYRVLAADRTVPFGTIMRVTLADGTQFDGIVMDRGKDIVHGRLDVLVDTKSRAYELGRQQVRAEILN